MLIFELVFFSVWKASAVKKLSHLYCVCVCVIVLEYVWAGGGVHHACHTQKLMCFCVWLFSLSEWNVKLKIIHGKYYRFGINKDMGEMVHPQKDGEGENMHDWNN